MQIDRTSQRGNMSMPKVAALIFIPTALLTVIYIFMGYVQTAIPSVLLFFLLALIVLFPFEIGVILKASKKEHGKYSLKSAFNNYQKMNPWNVFMYGLILIGFAGIMSITVAPLENSLFAPLSDKIAQITPQYFIWTNTDYLKQYSKDILFVTCVVYFICNVIIGPVYRGVVF